jgi:hypothetical protein
VRGIVEPLLAESLAAEDAEERRCVVLVLHSFGELDHIAPALGLSVQLGERDGRIRGRLELLDDADRTLEVAVVLLQLSEREPNRVTIDGKLGRHSMRDREREPSEQVLGDELVLGRVLAGRERLPSNAHCPNFADGRLYAVAKVIAAMFRAGAS